MTDMVLRIFDVQHGACAMLSPADGNKLGPLAMIDSGDNTETGWTPSEFITRQLGRNRVDFLCVTNADQDHLSDFAGLAKAGIDVGVLSKNPTLIGDELRRLKLQQCNTLTRDIEDYIALTRTHVTPPQPIETFDARMGGITKNSFWNDRSLFPNSTNELSATFFFTFGGFKILFPGDLEVDGWKELLKNRRFVDQLSRTTVLVASHHGRYGGFCKEVFDYCKPDLIVISDKSVVHDTQETMSNLYGLYVPNGRFIDGRTRKVLTTRSDGSILFRVSADGNYRTSFAT